MTEVGQLLNYKWLDGYHFLCRVVTPRQEEWGAVKVEIVEVYKTADLHWKVGKSFDANWRDLSLPSPLELLAREACK